MKIIDTNIAMVALDVMTQLNESPANVNFFVLMTGHDKADITAALEILVEKGLAKESNGFYSK